MRLSISILLLIIIPYASAFAPLKLMAPSRPLFSSTDTNINYVISGDNIELTASLNSYVNKKLDNVVGKLATSGAVKECDVHLSVNKNPKVSDNSDRTTICFFKEAFASSFAQLSLHRQSYTL